MVKRISYMRLNLVGWVGAALMVGCPTAAAWIATALIRMPEVERLWRRPEIIEAWHVYAYMVLGAGMLVGMVMVAVGRQIVEGVDR